MKIDLEGRANKDAFKFLKENKAVIYDLKKTDLKLAECVVIGAGVLGTSVIKQTGANMNKYLYENDDANGILKRTIVANTYHWLDSHDDVHLSGLFGKSIQERGKRILHLHDHKRELGAKVGDPISWSEETLTWAELGITPIAVDPLTSPATKTTQALLLKSNILKRYNPQVYEMYLNDEIDQHSVGMRYVKFDLAINEPEDAYYKEEYAIWKEVFPKLGNQQKAFDQGYFFAVKEAILIENSAVLLGANELTPVLGNKIEPLKSTQQKSEPVRPLDLNKLLNAYYKQN